MTRALVTTLVALVAALAITACTEVVDLHRDTALPDAGAATDGIPGTDGPVDLDAIPGTDAGDPLDAGAAD